MSIQSIVAFNSGVDKLQQLNDHADAVKQKSIERQQAQENLDLSKKLDLAKTKEARNQGMINDYIGNALEKQISESYKSKQDVLDATGQIQDKAAHEIQMNAQGVATNLKQLHDADPDVQAHAQTLSGIMQANNGGQQGNVSTTPPMSMAPQYQQQQAQTQVAQPAQDSGIPSIIPQDAPAVQQAPVQSPIQNGQQAMPPQGSATNGIDLSPIEQAYGAPKGSMWIDPESGKPGINPIWKSKLEAQNKAQAAYDVNQPFREEKFYDDRFNKLDKNLDPASFRSGAFGDAKKVFDRGERLKTLVDATFAQPGGADNRQIAELAIGVQSMLSGGTGSTTEVMALLPRSIVGDTNKIAEWLSNNPTGSNQQKFVERLRDTVYREMDTTQAQMDRTRIQRLSNFDDLKNRDGDKYNDILNNYGLTQEKIDAYKKGGISELIKLTKQDREGLSENNSQVPDGRIEIISPDGRHGHIPAVQLDEAIKSGYKKAQ